MKRIAIVILYSKNGEFKKSVYYLLQQLKSVSERIDVIVNGLIDDRSFEEVHKYADNIFVRNNEGLELGAVSEYYEQIVDEIAKFDELIICNDTFFGPFIPMKDIFSDMDEIQADFWGLNLAWGFVTEVLQSYFRVFRKSIIESNILLQYFKNISFDGDYDRKDVVAIYEYGLYSYLLDNHFRCASYSCSEKYSVYRDVYELLTQNNLPVLKKKAFVDGNAGNTNLKKAIDYIISTKRFDVSIIEEEVSDINSEWKKNKDPGGQSRIVHVSRENIISFLGKQSELYIYGTGLIAREFYCVYKKYINNLIGFVVSDDQGDENLLYGHPIYKVSEVNQKDILLIVCVDYNVMEQIKDSLQEFSDVKYYRDKQFQAI